MSDFRAAAVESKCRELLRTLDLDKTSERKIRELLSTELGFSVDNFKGLISSVIDEFMSGEQRMDKDFTSVVAPNSAEPLVKKQKVVANEADLRSKWEGPPPVKKEVPASVPPEREKKLVNEEEEKNLKLSLDNIFDVLEDYGANGTTAKTIAEATKMEKSEVNRVLYMCLKRGMDFRLMHNSGKSPPTWALDVTKEKGDGGNVTVGAIKGAGGGPAVTSQSQATTQQYATAGAAVQQEQQQQQQQQQQQAEDAVDGEVCRLTNAKRVAVQVFKGAPTISFREYYQKDSKWLPGKKGINLNAEQFENLREKIADVEIKIDIVAAGNSESETVCELGGNKRLTVRKYMGKVMVDVREYYQNKNGEWAPGFKGLAFGREQWEIFVNHADQISATVETM